MKKTWNSIQEFALAHRSETVPAVTSEEMEEVAEKLSMEEMKRQAKEREGMSMRDPGQFEKGCRIPSLKIGSCLKNMDGVMISIFDNDPCKK